MQRRRRASTESGSGQRRRRRRVRRTCECAPHARISCFPLLTLPSFFFFSLLPRFDVCAARLAARLLSLLSPLSSLLLPHLLSSPPPIFSSLLLLPPPPPSSSSFVPPTYSLSWQMRSPFLDFSRRSLRSLHLWPSEQRASHRTTPLSSPPPPSFLSRSSPSCPLTRHRSARCCARPAMPLFVARCTRQVRSAQCAALSEARRATPLLCPPSSPLLSSYSPLQRSLRSPCHAFGRRTLHSPGEQRASRRATPLLSSPSSSSFHLIRRRSARCARPSLSKCAQRATPIPLVVARCARSPAALRKMHNECRM
jgi:hypothetical protein